MTSPKASVNEFDRIYCIDVLEGLRALADNSIDVAIVDPPYNTSKGGKWKWDNSAQLPGLGGNWNKIMESWDDMPLVDYFSFTLAYLTELKRVVKDTGSMWLHGTYHNAGVINFCLQILDVEIINEVVWYKRNSFPNLSGRRLTASHETIIWAHTGKKRKYLFNYERSRAAAYAEDGLKVAGKQMRTVWDVPNNKSKEELAFGKNPAQKPLRLARRMLALSAQPEWTCLVPFAGSGTECVAAQMEGLHYLGFESDPEQVQIAENRLKSGQRALLLTELQK